MSTPKVRKWPFFLVWARIDHYSENPQFCNLRERIGQIGPSGRPSPYQPLLRARATVYIVYMFQDPRSPDARSRGRILGTQNDPFRGVRKHPRSPMEGTGRYMGRKGPNCHRPAKHRSYDLPRGLRDPIPDPRPPARSRIWTLDALTTHSTCPVPLVPRLRAPQQCGSSYST